MWVRNGQFVLVANDERFLRNRRMMSAKARKYQNPWRLHFTATSHLIAEHENRPVSNVERSSSVQWVFEAKLISQLLRFKLCASMVEAVRRRKRQRTPLNLGILNFENSMMRLFEFYHGH